MSYNALIGVEVVTDVTVEPVTLDEVKRHLNLIFDTDDSFTFTDDDTYLTELIPECREALEKITGLSFAPKTLKATIQNSVGGAELPYGPVTSEVDYLDEDGEVPEITMRGARITTCSDYLVATYDAGYEVLPKALKRALLEEIAWRYNHRGEEVDISEPARKLAKLYKTITWLL